MESIGLVYSFYSSATHSLRHSVATTCLLLQVCGKNLSSSSFTPCSLTCIPSLLIHSLSFPFIFHSFMCTCSFLQWRGYSVLTISSTHLSSLTLQFIPFLTLLHLFPSPGANEQGFDSKFSLLCDWDYFGSPPDAGCDVHDGRGNEDHVRLDGNQLSE